ncbi:hypothetical protein ACTA71_011924 [Dictyostelium dimigraforme]
MKINNLKDNSLFLSLFIFLFFYIVLNIYDFIKKNKKKVLVALLFLVLFERDTEIGFGKGDRLLLTKTLPLNNILDYKVLNKNETMIILGKNEETNPVGNQLNTILIKELNFTVNFDKSPPSIVPKENLILTLPKGKALVVTPIEFDENAKSKFFAECILKINEKDVYYNSTFDGSFFENYKVVKTKVFSKHGVLYLTSHFIDKTNVSFIRAVLTIGYDWFKSFLNLNYVQGFDNFKYNEKTTLSGFFK